MSKGKIRVKPERKDSKRPISPPPAPIPKGEQLSAEILTNPCAKNAREGEPVFVLLGRDPQAPGAIRNWANRRIPSEGMSDKITSAFKVAHAMERYQKEQELKEARDG